MIRLLIKNPLRLLQIKFVYSEKATKFCKISTFFSTDKSKVEISQNFVAFSEYMNFMLLGSSFIYVSTYIRFGVINWIDSISNIRQQYMYKFTKSAKGKKKITQFPNRPPPTSPLFPLALFDSNAGILSENQREYVLRYFRE